MTFPEKLKYTESHEWVRIEGEIAVIGITDYAQGELGDIVFIDIPELKDVSHGEAFGSIEAVKTVSDLIAPLSGTLVEMNAELEASPELVNSDPYDKGWMVKMRFSNGEEIDSLLDASKYKSLIGQ